MQPEEFLDARFGLASLAYLPPPFVPEIEGSEFFGCSQAGLACIFSKMAVSAGLATSAIGIDKIAPGRGKPASTDLRIHTIAFRCLLLS